MSKLINVLELLNDIEEAEMLIRICNVAMKDAEKALVNDKTSKELMRIYESAEDDKESLMRYHKELSVQLCEMLDSLENDSAFLYELETTHEVNEDYKKSFAKLKDKMLASKAKEKSEE